jgi:hypothetical protein
MKLDKAEKITIGVLLFLFVIAIISNIKNFKKTYNVFDFYIPGTEQYDLPIDVTRQAQEYNEYTELYSTTKPTLVYSYNEFDLTADRNTKFHKELTQRLKQENLDENVLVYKNWEEDTDEVLAKHKTSENQSSGSSCSLEEGDTKLENFIKTAHHCIDNICILDVKNHKYTIISPKIDYIVEKYKDYIQSTK